MTSGSIPSRAERRNAGKALRKACPRASHATLTAGKDRDPLALIELSNVDRLAHLVPVRHERMSESAFAFFRGTALIQAHDLAQTPVSGIRVQACGDCHLQNFGGYGTPERDLVFDIDDFDETLPAPWEWDLKRLATSFVLAARWRNLRPADAQAAAWSAVEAYRVAMARYADMRTLDIWYDHLSLLDLAETIQDDKALAGRVEGLIRRCWKRWPDPRRGLTTGSAWSQASA
jgi:hypothetical protein